MITKQDIINHRKELETMMMTNIVSNEHISNLNIPEVTNDGMKKFLSTLSDEAFGELIFGSVQYNKTTSIETLLENGKNMNISTQARDTFGKSVKDMLYNRSKNNNYELSKYITDIDIITNRDKIIEVMGMEIYTPYNIHKFSKEKMMLKQYDNINFIRYFRKYIEVIFENNIEDRFPTGIHSVDEFIQNVCEYHPQNITEFMTSTVNRQYNDVLNDYNPSDKIVLDDDALKVLSGLWDPNLENGEYIPSDLYYNNTIPLKDCEIHVNSKEDPRIKCRILFSDDAFKHCKSIIYGQKTIGIMSIVFSFSKHKERKSDHSEFIAIINLNEDTHVIEIQAVIGIRSGDTDHLKLLFGNNLRFFVGEMREWLRTWYSIQISLLHPQIREIFLNPEMEAINQDSNNRKYSKNPSDPWKVKYIRTHIIKSSDIIQAVTGGSSNFNRRRMSWYVIGHWREYKYTKKKIFIQGYWKGPLRETKMNHDEIRERIVDAGTSQESIAN